MNTIRAQQIAEAFSPINSFAVDSIDHGVQVDYLGHKAFFNHESCFWDFAFKLGQVNHEEGQVAEIEMKLYA